MNHFETKWKSSDNLDIFAQGWDPDKSPPRAVVCLVHGIGEHRICIIRSRPARTW
jgi:alpha-beta hydrolase superfamily lysophospholipase